MFVKSETAVSKLMSRERSRGFPELHEILSTTKDTCDRKKHMASLTQKPVMGTEKIIVSKSNI